MPDTLVKMYDVRTLRALPPISFPAGPAFCALHPNDTSKIFLASQQGALECVDLTAGTLSELVQLDVQSYLTALAISPMGDYLVFGDADGSVHVWTSHETNVDQHEGAPYYPPFNGYDGFKPEVADAPEPPKVVHWTNTT